MKIYEIEFKANLPEFAYRKIRIRAVDFARAVEIVRRAYAAGFKKIISFKEVEPNKIEEVNDRIRNTEDQTIENRGSRSN